MPYNGSSDSRSIYLSKSKIFLIQNYCDKAEIIEEVKQKALTFFPLTSEERVNMKVETAKKGKSKLKKKSLNIIK